VSINHQIIVLAGLIVLVVALDRAQLAFEARLGEQTGAPALTHQEIEPRHTDDGGRP